MALKIEYRGFEWIFLALLCLIVPYDWLIASFLAAGIHELSHYYAVKLTGGQIHTFKIGLKGAVLDTTPMDTWKEVLCIGAGPTGSLLLILITQWAPQIAVCGALQGIYNLIPVYPLDGGRILYSITRRLFSESTSETVCCFVKSTVIFTVILVGVCGGIHFKTILIPVVAAFFLFSIIRLGKNSCKHG